MQMHEDVIRYHNIIYLYDYYSKRQSTFIVNTGCSLHFRMFYVVLILIRMSAVTTSSVDVEYWCVMKWLWAGSDEGWWYIVRTGLTGVVRVKADLHPIRVTGHKHTGRTLICCRGTFISQTVIKLHLHLCSPHHQALLQQDQLSHHSHMTSEAEIWCDWWNGAMCMCSVNVIWCDVLMWCYVMI